MSELLVRDLMTSKVVTLHQDASLDELLDLLNTEHIRHVPVVDGGGELVGLATHRDIVRVNTEAGEDLPVSVSDDVATRRGVSEVMTSGVLTVEPETSVDYAADVMLDNKLGCLPVVENKRLVGILTEADFVKHVRDS